MQINESIYIRKSVYPYTRNYLQRDFITGKCECEQDNKKSICKCRPGEVYTEGVNKGCVNVRRSENVPRMVCNTPLHHILFMADVLFEKSKFDLFSCDVFCFDFVISFVYLRLQDHLFLIYMRIRIKIVYYSHTTMCVFIVIFVTL